MICLHFFDNSIKDIGEKEIKRLSATIARKISAEDNHKSESKAFQHYSRRLVRDLEAKGIVRTSVESLLLSLQADNPDIFGAECFRTFPNVCEDC